MSISQATGWPLHALATALGLKALGETDTYIAGVVGAAPADIARVLRIARRFVTQAYVAEACAFHEAVDAGIAEKLSQAGAKRAAFRPRRFRPVPDIAVERPAAVDLTAVLMGDPPRAQKLNSVPPARDIRDYDRRINAARQGSLYGLSEDA